MDAATSIGDELENDKKRRIALNRQRALELYEKKRKIDEEKVEVTHKCEVNNSDGSVCGGIIDMSFFESYSEKACRRCIKDSESLQQVTKVELKEHFLLTDSVINKMPYILVDNPRNKHWSQMKLYLKKHAIQKSIEKWGTEEDLNAERTRREQRKFEEKLDDAKHFFANVDKSAMSIDEGCDSNLSTVKMKRQNKRKHMIRNMVACIKGESNSNI
jgi:DNA repair protein